MRVLFAAIVALLFVWLWQRDRRAARRDSAAALRLLESLVAEVAGLRAAATASASLLTDAACAAIAAPAHSTPATAPPRPALDPVPSPELPACRSGSPVGSPMALPAAVAATDVAAMSFASPLGGGVASYLEQQQQLDTLKRRLLRRVTAFADMPSAFFERVAQDLQHENAPAGVAIVSQGEYGEEMYFLAEGKVRVEIHRKFIRVINAGSYFGEIALLDGGLRTATCLAETACELFTLSRNAFLSVVAEYPSARAAMEKEMVVREVQREHGNVDMRNPTARADVDRAVEERLRERTALHTANRKRQWQVQARIGQGAQGVVYSALDRSNGKPLAVKVIELGGIPERARLAVEQESALMQTLHHPNVVQGYGIQLSGDGAQASVLMELLPMGSLAALVRRGGPMPEATVQAYTRQLLSGLHYLHGRGVLHRDLKPGNLLLSEAGVVKVADFGISKLGAAAVEQHSNTLVGTPGYLSPDAIQGKYSVYSDVWAVGCTVLELVTGLPPYHEKQRCFDSPTQLIFYIATSGKHPTIPPALSPATAAEAAADSGCFVAGSDKARPPGAVSPALRSFLAKTFSATPSERGDCADLLAHAWLTTPDLPTHPAFESPFEPAPSSMSVQGGSTLPDMATADLGGAMTVTIPMHSGGDFGRTEDGAVPASLPA